MFDERRLTVVPLATIRAAGRITQKSQGQHTKSLSLEVLEEG